MSLPLQFVTGVNLSADELCLGEPWEFIVERETNPFTRMPKEQRRKVMLQPTTKWNVYSAVVGLSPTQRVSKENPPARLNGLVADYDMKTSIEDVCKYLNQIDEKLLPNFIEVSLSGKIRLVWVFERSVMVHTSAFAAAFLEAIHDKMGLPTLLAGYDAASTKPAEVWTNGGEWHTIKETPLDNTFVFGVLCDVAKKSTLFGDSEIPLDQIEAEIKKRWPNRWAGDFRVDQVGVRFWDDKADAQAGCQVKPDGMLCFTGKVPFMYWRDLFGTAWCDERRAMNLGAAGKDVYFDGKDYWEEVQNHWVTLTRTDAMLMLKDRGLGDKARKGSSTSDVERVLRHIQVTNRVDGAGPLINYAPGVQEIEGRRLLNTAHLTCIVPIKGLTGTTDDFPLIWQILSGLFARPHLKPLDYFLTWLRRFYKSQINFERRMGQAIFICGPKENGKTLVCDKIIKPLVGNKSANPMQYLLGATAFNSQLFECALLAINDEDGPKSESHKQVVGQKIKALTVNPSHEYHPKFRTPIALPWTGRLVVTGNDDPASAAILPEVVDNTMDKMMFFASQPFAGEWPERDALEDQIARELPYFAWWLLNVYQPPKEILANNRNGMKSFFDPVILNLANQQMFSYNLAELLQAWMQVATVFSDGGVKFWTGTPTSLLSELSTCATLEAVSREWTTAKIAKSLTGLARQADSGVEFHGDTGREFKITPKIKS